MLATPTVAAPATDPVVVIGAGPAGLSAALELARGGTPVTVLERDPLCVGGRSRTIEFMGCRFDLGSQILSTLSGELAAVSAALLGEAMQPVQPRGRMFYRGKLFDDPLKLLEACRTLGPLEGGRCLASYLKARLRPGEGRSFEDRRSNEIGPRLFAIFGRAYVEKVSGVAARELATSWPGTAARASGSGHAADNNGEGDGLYPTLGAGQLWEAFAARLERTGHRVRMGEEVVGVRHGKGRVIAVAARDRAGRSVDLLGSHFISTMPLRDLVARLWPAAPGVVREGAAGLAYRNVIRVNVVLERGEVFPDHWISIHDPSVKVARISNYKNFSPGMVADPGLTGLGMEYFCGESDALWGKSDADLLDLARRELVSQGICRGDDVKAGMVCRQESAYPLNDAVNRDRAALVGEWVSRALPNLWLLRAEGMTTQGAALEGMALARRIATGPASDWSAEEAGSGQHKVGPGGRYTGRVFAPE